MPRNGFIYILFLLVVFHNYYNLKLSNIRYMYIIWYANIRNFIREIKIYTYEDLYMLIAWTYKRGVKLDPCKIPEDFLTSFIKLFKDFKFSQKFSYLITDVFWFKGKIHHSI